MSTKDLHIVLNILQALLTCCIEKLKYHQPKRES